MEAHADSDQRCNAACESHQTLGWSAHPGENPQECRLARPIAPQDPDRFALLDVQRHVSESPVLGPFGSSRSERAKYQRAFPDLPVAFAHPVELNSQTH